MRIPYSSAEEIARGLLAQLKGTQVVDSRGLPKVVAHGTNTAFTELSSASIGSMNLHGPGFYHTEDLGLASTYAGGHAPKAPGLLPRVMGGLTKIDYWADRREGYALLTQSVSRAKVATGSHFTMDLLEFMDKVRTPQERASSGFQKAFEEVSHAADELGLETAEDLDTFIRDERRDVMMNVRKAKGPIYQPGARNVRLAHLNIKNALDLDQRVAAMPPKQLETLARIARQRGTQYSEFLLKPTINYPSGKRISWPVKEYLERELRSWERWTLSDVLNAHDSSNIGLGKIAKNDALHIRRIVKTAGYDGLSHTGGIATGGKPHKVWIALDKKQVLPAFWRRFPKLGVYGVAFLAAAVIGSWLLEDRKTSSHPMGV